MSYQTPVVLIRGARGDREGREPRETGGGLIGDG